MLALNENILPIFLRSYNNYSNLKGKVLIDDIGQIWMRFDADGNVNIYPITQNHTYIDKEHNETIVFNPNGVISIHSETLTTPTGASAIKTDKPKTSNVDMNSVSNKIKRFNEFKLKGIKYQTHPTTEEELEFRRLYQAIKYYEKILNVDTF